MLTFAFFALTTLRSDGTPWCTRLLFASTANLARL
jgi:hypothetical protein